MITLLRHVHRALPRLAACPHFECVTSPLRRNDLRLGTKKILTSVYHGIGLQTIDVLL